MLQSDRHRIIGCDIGIRDVSDHAEVYLRLHLDVQPKNTVWRLNTSLLNDPQCIEYIEFNNNEVMSSSVLWDAAKAVLRGKLLKWSLREKKEKQKILTDLSTSLKALEQKHIELNKPQILEEIKVRKQQINKILDKQVEIKLKYIKQKYYENGPRAKKMLAWKLRKQQTERSVFKIRNPETSVTCYKTEDILRSFEIYYKKLYSQPEAADPSIIENFLESLDLPSVGLTQNNLVTQEITEAEIDKAISNLKANKVPGGWVSSRVVQKI